MDSVPLPDCGPRDAIVEIHACGICCSDLSYIRLGGLAGPGGARAESAAVPRSPHLPTAG